MRKCASGESLSILKLCATSVLSHSIVNMTKRIAKLTYRIATWVIYTWMAYLPGQKVEVLRSRRVLHVGAGSKIRELSECGNSCSFANLPGDEAVGKKFMMAKSLAVVFSLDGTILDTGSFYLTITRVCASLLHETSCSLWHALGMLCCSSWWPQEPFILIMCKHACCINEPKKCLFNFKAANVGSIMCAQWSWPLIYFGRNFCNFTTTTVSHSLSACS